MGFRQKTFNKHVHKFLVHKITEGFLRSLKIVRLRWVNNRNAVLSHLKPLYGRCDNWQCLPHTHRYNIVSCDRLHSIQKPVSTKSQVNKKCINTLLLWTLTGGRSTLHHTLRNQWKRIGCSEIHAPSKTSETAEK